MGPPERVMGRLPVFVDLLVAIGCDNPRLDYVMKGDLLADCRLVYLRQNGLRWIVVPAPALCLCTGLRVVRITLRLFSLL